MSHSESSIYELSVVTSDTESLEQIYQSIILRANSQSSIQHIRSYFERQMLTSEQEKLWNQIKEYYKVLGVSSIFQNQFIHEFQNNMQEVSKLIEKNYIKKIAYSQKFGIFKINF